jgi:tRNA A-37 threonylcarbamoyl transferase component Bud32
VRAYTPPQMVGVSVGSYRILGPLGEGGMGVVYRAEHVLLGRPAAVKVLLPEHSRNQEIVNRFFNEARAATAIRHPSIVEIYDFGYHADGSAYIVMELLEGEGLSRRLAREGRLELPRAVAIARQISGALSAAHARRIVHRDLKPDNVFLVADPEVPGGERIKLLDFGIAKLSAESATGMRTRTGSVMGTPTYMAPEQCRGVALDHRADLYALGCILFEMVLGTPPFRGEGSGDVLAAHIHLAPPLPRSIAAEVPVPLENLMLALLAKAPDKRPSSAGHVVQLIDSLGVAGWLGDVGLSPARFGARQSAPTTLSGAARVTAVTQRGRGSRWATYGLIGAAALAIGVGVVVSRVGNSESPLSIASSRTVVAASTPPAIEQAAAVPVAAPPAPDTAIARPGAAVTPASIDVQITSSPEGAEILMGTTSIGRTPLHTQVASAPSLVLVVRLAGYVDATVNTSADGPLRRHIVLKKRPRRETSRNPF